MLFLTDENTWTSVVENDWIYLQSTYFIIPMESNWTIYQMFKIYPTKNKLMKGVENSTACQEALLSKLSCNCFAIYYNHLGLLPCKNYSELQCVGHELYNLNEKERLDCFKPKEFVSYKGHLSKVPVETPSETGIVLAFKFPSQTLVKREEIYIVGPLDFIGNMGGSLGLLLGFSCFPFLSWLTNYFLKELKTYLMNW